MCARRFTRFVFLLGALMASGLAAGAVLPSAVPQSDEIVATQLLPRALKDSLRRLATAAPAADLAQSLAAARRMIEVGRANGDPRTLGYAEALLAPWPADAIETPVDAIVLHATIAQSRHAFTRARTLLDRVLERSKPGAPAFAQALLTRATVSQVTGELEPARVDCERLLPFARDVAAICVASVDMLAGRTDAAIALLKVAATRTSDGVRAWALGALAQAYELRGQRGAAASAYQAALAAGDDLVTRLAYADFLLADGSGATAANLLRDAPPTDGVVLRQWRSARLQQQADATTLEERLRTRLADARQRGDGSDLLHARDWAQFELERGNTSEALRLAQANWRDQREPADLLILARAAKAAGDAKMFAEVRSWIARTKLQDVRLSEVLQEAHS
jgi:tetratricopeptide (TPR) repeat protein